jgi:hypothetical protein
MRLASAVTDVERMYRRGYPALERPHRKDLSAGTDGSRGPAKGGGGRRRSEQVVIGARKVEAVPRRLARAPHPAHARSQSATASRGIVAVAAIGHSSRTSRAWVIAAEAESRLAAYL